MLSSSVVVASSNSENLKEWVNTLANNGVEARPCTDMTALELAFHGGQAPNAVVLEIPFDGHEDVTALKSLSQGANQRPGLVAVIPHSLREELVKALENGVEVTLTGPARSEEVLAAVTRALKANDSETCLSEAWGLDTISWVLNAPNGDQPIPLSYKEREFLLRVGNQPGEPVAKEHFADLFGTTPELFDPRRLEIMLRRLRNKVRSAVGQELPLHTAHGVGYAFGGLIRLKGAPGGTVDRDPPAL